MSKTTNTSNWIRRIGLGVVLAAAPFALALGVDTAADAKVPPFDTSIELHDVSDTSSVQTAPIHHNQHHSVRTFGFDY